MCGICGVFNFLPKPVMQAELRRMNGLLRHRGPDGEGYYFGNRAALAMRRLAVMDVEQGNQPFYSEDGNIVAVFNGEFYGFRSARTELERKGHIFHTQSDAELVPHLYEEYGEDFPNYIRGMFAAAVYDIGKHRLVLARDRIGKKPLYYSIYDGRLVFSSELQSLMAADGISHEINLEALDLFLSLQCVPAPLSIYRNVGKLPPGNILVANDSSGVVETKKYWDLPLSSEKKYPKKKFDFEEAKTSLYSLAEECVKIRMDADVPLGAFLSGGLDSSVIVALMAKNSSKPVRTFSIGFKEEDFSELPYARLVARKYGTEHSEFVVEDNMAEMLPEIAAAYGEPFADPSMMPSFLVCREARKGVTVALNGDGGDELFGGYNRYRAFMLEQAFFKNIPNFMKTAALRAISVFPKEAPFGMFWKIEKFLRMSACSDEAAKYLYLRSFVKPEDFPSLCTDRYRAALDNGICRAKGYMSNLFDLSGNEDTLNRMIYADFHSWLPDVLMTKMDIASMRNSLEARSPLLDHNLAEFAWNLPPQMKTRGFRGGGSKWLFRRTFAHLLPQEMLSRHKTGFGIPLGRWMRGRLKKTWLQTCLNGDAIRRGLFNQKALETMAEEHFSGRQDNGYQMWVLLMLENWFRRFEPEFKM